jgi:hypothetical protein
VWPTNEPALPQAPPGPTGRRERENDPAGTSCPRRCEVFEMATITKVRNKLERVSALKGWRMRWYMQ